MRPDLDFLDELFERGNDFQLTDMQYEKKSGLSLPQNTSYLLKRSALAKKCKKNGYKLRLQERLVYFEKEKSGVLY